jgi:hypothetical protein
MVNNIAAVRLGAMDRAVGAYATVAFGTPAALAVTAAVAPSLATSA